MSKKVIAAVLLSGMFLSLIILLLTIAYAVKRQQISAERAAGDLVSQVDAPQETVLPTVTVISYSLKEYQGELAVFRGDSPDPYQKLSVPLNLMTDEDRALLREGITVYSEKELKSLIEDFTS